MAFSGPNEYELRFRPENRKGKCELCTWPENKDHITLACQYLAGTTVPENMAMRLEEIPEMTNENDAINALVPGQVENEDPSKSNDAKTHHASQDASIEESAALKRAVKRNKNKKTKSKRPTGDGSASAHPPAKPNKVVKPGFKAKLTKRGKRLAAVVDNHQSQMVGEGLLSNGKHLVFRPPPTKKEINEGAMIEIVMDSLEGGVVPESVSPVKAHVWTVCFATIEDARASVGRGADYKHRSAAVDLIGRFPEWQQILVRCIQATRSRRGQTCFGPGDSSRSHNNGLKNSAQPNGKKDCNTKYANKSARKQRLALMEVAVEELNALTIADRPLGARSNGKFQMKPISTLNKTERVNKRVRGTENAVLTATNKDAVVCLKGKGTTIPKNDGKSSDTDLTSYKPIVGNKRVRYDNAVVQKKPTRPAEDKDAAVHQKGKGVAVPKHDDAVSQEKSARSAENKDAAVHQKKNDIAVPGHNVVEVQQISTEPAEDILVPKTPGTNHQYRGTAINHVGRIPEWQQVLVRCAQKTRSRRGQTSPGPGGNHDDGFPGSERIRTTIQARES
ncbi:hypothetical protein E4U35_006538 [Claviceps purpurea]|nr:hypothetical protein E4U35_006538 [Claviceps purpurea]